MSVRCPSFFFISSVENCHRVGIRSTTFKGNTHLLRSLGLRRSDENHPKNLADLALKLLAVLQVFIWVICKVVLLLVRV